MAIFFLKQARSNLLQEVAEHTLWAPQSRIVRPRIKRETIEINKRKEKKNSKLRWPYFNVFFLWSISFFTKYLLNNCSPIVPAEGTVTLPYTLFTGLLPGCYLRHYKRSQMLQNSSFFILFLLGFLPQDLKRDTQNVHGFAKNTCITKRCEEKARNMPGMGGGGNERNKVNCVAG